MLDYLYNCLSVIEAPYHDCGIILLRDFNNNLFKWCSRLVNSFKLKQIVDFPTRGANTLDPVFTHLAFGLSYRLYYIEVQPLKFTEQSKIKTDKAISYAHGEQGRFQIIVLIYSIPDNKLQCATLRWFFALANFGQ